MGVVTETEVKPDGTTIYRTIHEEVVVNQNFAASVPIERDEAYTITFVYDGLERVVQDPQITRGAYNYRKGYNALLGGVELSRDGVPTGAYKNYSLDLISPA